MQTFLPSVAQAHPSNHLRFQNLLQCLSMADADPRMRLSQGPWPNWHAHTIPFFPVSTNLQHGSNQRNYEQHLGIYAQASTNGVAADANHGDADILQPGGVVMRADPSQIRFTHDSIS